MNTQPHAPPISLVQKLAAALMDQGVFQAEDISVSEGARRGMRSGADSDLLFGGLEESAVQFHQTIARELAG